MNGNNSNNRNDPGFLPTHHFHRINLPNVFRRLSTKSDKIKFVNCSQSYGAAKFNTYILHISKLLFISIVKLDVATRARCAQRVTKCPISHKPVCTMYIRCQFVHYFPAIKNCSR